MKYPQLLFFLCSLVININLSAQVDTIVMDIEGNVYTTVRIGDQTWLKENLKATRLNDGTPIPEIKGNMEWGGRTSPGFCWYNNDSFNKDFYGGLYNWFTIASGKICPAGWHVPSDREWITLEDFLGGSNESGIKLKETGSSHWQRFEPGGTNESGLTLLPGGYRMSNGKFSNIGQYSFLWSSSEFLWDISTYYTHFSWGRYICYYNSISYRYYFEKKYGFSIRCLKDIPFRKS